MTKKLILREIRGNGVTPSDARFRGRLVADADRGQFAGNKVPEGCPGFGRYLLDRQGMPVGPCSTCPLALACDYVPVLENKDWWDTHDLRRIECRTYTQDQDWVDVPYPDEDIIVYSPRPIDLSKEAREYIISKVGPRRIVVPRIQVDGTGTWSRGYLVICMRTIDFTQLPDLPPVEQARYARQSLAWRVIADKVEGIRFDG